MKIFLLSPSIQAVACALRKRVFAQLRKAPRIIRQLGWRAAMWGCLFGTIMPLAFAALLTPVVWMMSAIESANGLDVVMGRLSKANGNAEWISVHGFWVVAGVLTFCATLSLAQFVFLAARNLWRKPAGTPFVEHLFNVSTSPVSLFMPPIDAWLMRASLSLEAWAVGQKSSRPFFWRDLGCGALAVANLGVIAGGLFSFFLMSLANLALMLFAGLLMALRGSKVFAKTFVEQLREEGAEDFARQERAVLARETAKSRSEAGTAEGRSGVAEPEQKQPARRL